MTTRKRISKAEDAQFKVIMVGRSAAGKSSLLARYTKNVFDNNYQVTVGR
jgi:GTPase SAR1 family protein